MVSVTSIAAAAPDTAAVLRDIDGQIGATSRDAAFVYAFYGSCHDDWQLHGFLTDRFPQAAILGGTSCSGVMNQARLWGPASIGILIISDPEGDYGVAAAPLGDDPAASAERTLHRALAAAGCPGELPELIWIYQSPGSEEAVIEGLQRVVGNRCPIIGGSSADDAVEGNWRQLGPDGIMRDGLVVGVLFPSGGVGYAFQGGYEPAGPSGVVTRVGFDKTGSSGIATRTRGRQIISIDDVPAAQVYNDWIGTGSTASSRRAAASCSTRPCFRWRSMPETSAAFLITFWCIRKPSAPTARSIRSRPSIKEAASTACAVKRDG
jgi:hypothetical protein